MVKNTLVVRKHDASALFGYTQQYHSFNGRRVIGQRQGLLCLIPTVEPQGSGPRTPDHGPCESDYGPLVLAL